MILTVFKYKNNEIDSYGMTKCMDRLSINIFGICGNIFIPVGFSDFTDFLLSLIEQITQIYF